MKATGQFGPQLADLLRQAGAPAKEVNVFGSHCIVTCLCFDSAKKAGRLLQESGWEVKWPKQSIDGKLPGALIDVWRVWGKLLTAPLAA